MIKIILSLPLSLTLLGCAAGVEAPVTTSQESSQSQQEPQRPETKVFIQENKLYYQGGLSDEANQQAATLLRQYPQVKTLVIQSRGGEIGLGMDLADMVFAKGLAVKVQDYCFSSCANYVFPAAKTKYVTQHAQLGWHGGAFQKFEFDDEEMRQAYQAYIGPMQERERAFFQKIGVNPDITTLGQKPEYAAYSQCVGWSYTRSKLRELGVQNVIYSDGLWQPAANFEGKCIFTVSSS